MRTSFAPPALALALLAAMPASSASAATGRKNDVRIGTP